MIKVLGPVIIILFVLAVIIGLMNWAEKTKDRLNQISKSPISLFIWLVLSGILVYFFFKYATPLFR